MLRLTAASAIGSDLRSPPCRDKATDSLVETDALRSALRICSSEAAVRRGCSHEDTSFHD